MSNTVVPFADFRPLEIELDGKLKEAFERVLESSRYIQDEEGGTFERFHLSSSLTRGCNPLVSAMVGLSNFIRMFTSGPAGMGHS